MLSNLCAAGYMFGDWDAAGAFICEIFTSGVLNTTTAPALLLI